MRLAVLADIHYATLASPVGSRRCDVSDILLLRAVHRLNRYLRPDLVVLLGDLINDGDGPQAELELGRLQRCVELLDAPVLVLPGNHDPAPERFYQTMPRPAPAVDHAGIRVLSFLDAERPGYNAHRAEQDLARLRCEANRESGPLVCLQHVPLFPPGLHDCPYNYTNAADIISASCSAGVSLVISGHYHRGIPLIEQDGVRYLAAPALCESPFRFLTVDIEGDSVEVEEHSLAMPAEFELVDTHVHSSLAYCGENLDLAKSQSLADAMGLAGVLFTEHTGHLYFNARGYGRCADTGLPAAHPRQCRVETYFGLLQASGIPPKSWGMEVDAGWDGSGLIKPEHEARLAFRIGAIHSLRSLNGPVRDPEKAADEFLAVLRRFLGNGYDTVVGERGYTLSGGQRQRIAIARAFYKRADVLIFDEATSALDSQTENDIQISLKEVSKNKTTLVIAHRLSTIVDADEILVLQDGKITERGRHSDLIALNGIYASMWARQQEAKEYQTKLDKVLKH